MASEGFVRARVDGQLHQLEEEIPLDRRRNHTIEVVVDRLLLKPGIETRLAASIETAMKLAKGIVQVAEIVLTFDDGYAGLARHAFPVLADHGFRPLVFVISDYVGRENSWDVQYGWRRFAHLDWDELAVWRQRAGLEVHSHGATHARLTWLGDAQALDELERSRETIAARLGTPPIAVSYPFGSVDARVMGLSARAGFRLGFTGPTRAAPQPLALPRLPVYGWDAGARPLVLGGSPLSAAGLALARITNRCAVGTAAIQRLLGRRYGRGVRA